MTQPLAVTPAQRDIRWFYWCLGNAGHKALDSADAQAFAERVAIMVADGGLTETEARREAVGPYLARYRDRPGAA